MFSSWTLCITHLILVWGTDQCVTHETGRACELQTGMYCHLRAFELQSVPMKRSIDELSWRANWFHFQGFCEHPDRIRCLEGCVHLQVALGHFAGPPLTKRWSGGVWLGPGPKQIFHFACFSLPPKQMVGVSKKAYFLVPKRILHCWRGVLFIPCHYLRVSNCRNYENEWFQMAGFSFFSSQPAC